MSDKPNYAAYWAALLARHRALIAAGCISPVGVKRVVLGKREDEPSDDGSER